MRYLDEMSAKIYDNGEKRLIKMDLDASDLYFAEYRQKIASKSIKKCNKKLEYERDSKKISKLNRQLRISEYELEESTKRIQGLKDGTGPLPYWDRVKLEQQQQQQQKGE